MVFLVEVAAVAANTLELVLVFVAFPVGFSSTFGYPVEAFILWVSLSCVLQPIIENNQGRSAQIALQCMH